MVKTISAQPIARKISNQRLLRAGGVTIATLCKLLEAGVLDPEAETVVLNTGDGLKTLDAVRGSFETHEIDPTVEDFQRQVEGTPVGVA